jgi:hypothetical protein
VNLDGIENAAGSRATRIIDATPGSPDWGAALIAAAIIEVTDRVVRSMGGAPEEIRRGRRGAGERTEDATLVPVFLSYKPDARSESRTATR